MREERRRRPRQRAEYLATMVAGEGAVRYCLVTEMSDGGVRITAHGYGSPTNLRCAYPATELSFSEVSPSSTRVLATSWQRETKLGQLSPSCTARFSAWLFTKSAFCKRSDRWPFCPLLAKTGERHPLQMRLDPGRKTKSGRRRPDPPGRLKSNFIQRDTGRSGSFFLIIHDRAFLPEQPPIPPMWESTMSFGRHGSSTPVTRVRR
jgi:hypothetical protein